MGMWRRLTGAIGIAAVLAWSGCGGGDQPASPQERAAFAAKASKFCEADLRRSERHALRVVENKALLYIRHEDLPEFIGPLRRQEIATVLAPAQRLRIKKVRALGIPPGDEEKVEAILARVDKIAKEAEENPFGYLSENKKAKEQARAAAAAYGIESCATLFERGQLYDRGSARPGARLIPLSSK